MVNIKISIRLPSEIIKDLEEQVNRKEFKNLSEALRSRIILEEGVI